MEVSGKVKKVAEEQTFGSGFKKRELILQTEEQYPQYLSIEFVQDKTDLLQEVKEGDDVKISINLRGREWTSPEGVVKYFNSIIGWRIEKMVAVEPGSTGTSGAPSFDTQTTNVSRSVDLSSEADQDDDLPF